MTSGAHRALSKIAELFLTWFSRVPSSLRPRQLALCAPWDQPGLHDGIWGVRGCPCQLCPG